MNEQLEAEESTRAKPRLTWKEVLIGALLLWIGTANLALAVRLYDGHQGTLGGLFLLVCECALLVGSGTTIVLGARPLFTRRKETRHLEDDWGGINARRLRRLAIVSFVGLAWCLGSLR